MTENIEELAKRIESNIAQYNKIVQQHLAKYGTELLSFDFNSGTLSGKFQERDPTLFGLLECMKIGYHEAVPKNLWKEITKDVESYKREKESQPFERSVNFNSHEEDLHLNDSVSIKKEGVSCIKSVDGKVTYLNTKKIIAFMELGAKRNSNKEDTTTKEVTIAYGISSIPCKAFQHCTSLTKISIPKSVTSIGNSAFLGCKGLTSINVPDSVTCIGERAFQYCKGLTSINIPDSVTSIGGFTFSGCKGLTSINIPDSVTSIGSYTFYDCKGLTSINIPDSVTSIGDSAFSGCTGLASITIPDSVTRIGEYTFKGCKKLTSINIPDSVTSIGRGAFQYCKGLTSINVPDSVTSIGGGAFDGYTGRLFIPKSVKELPLSLFHFPVLINSPLDSSLQGEAELVMWSTTCINSKNNDNAHMKLKKLTIIIDNNQQDYSFIENINKNIVAHEVWYYHRGFFYKDNCPELHKMTLIGNTINMQLLESNVGTESQVVKSDNILGAYKFTIAENYENN